MNADFYRTVWRWHFYGGLLALPFLAWLAVTGSLYLFKDEIEHAAYGGLIAVPHRSGTLPASILVANAEQALDGKVNRIEIPASNHEAWRMRIVGTDAEFTAFIDPGDGNVQGAIEGGGVMQIVHDLHSLAITGPIGNGLIEMAAGWGIVLTITGIILWWPTRKKAPFKGKPYKQRGFWKDLHGTIGATGGVLALFLAVTGMPWSLVWGASLQRTLTQTGLGKPSIQTEQSGRRAAVDAPHHVPGKVTARADDLPWSLERLALPRDPAAVGGIDAVLFSARSAGMREPLAVGFPRDGSTFTIRSMQDKVENGRTLFIGRDGTVRGDSGFAQYGAGTKAVEWGVATHQGKQYGNANRWAMLAGCLTLLLLCVSAPVLWWKRRNSGRLARPPAAATPLRQRGFTIAMIACGLFFPLTGVSMLVIWFIDVALGARYRAPTIPDGSRRSGPAALFDPAQKSYTE